MVEKKKNLPFWISKKITEKLKDNNKTGNKKIYMINFKIEEKPRPTKNKFIIWKIVTIRDNFLTDPNY